MVIEKNKAVSVEYNLASKGKGQAEEIFVEKTSKEHPLVFLFGTGNMIPEFEKNLLGKKAGDKFDFRITSEHAYGAHDDDKYAEIPMEVFLDKNGKLDTTVFKVGAIIPMTDDHGNRIQAKIDKIGIGHITMDFNHPMAGHDLHFTGEVLEVRNATADEIAHGHVHGPGGHHH